MGFYDYSNYNNDDIMEGVCDYCGRDDGHTADCIYVENYDITSEDMIES